MFNLKNKIAVVTGGYGYLGKAIVDALLEVGATVYVFGKSQEKFDAVFGMSFYTGKVKFLDVDISSSKNIESGYEKVYSVELKIDILINNAYYSKGQDPEHMEDADWEYGIDGSLNSVFRCVKGIIPYFKNAKSGKIINVSSMYGIVSPNFAVYEDSPQFLNPPHYGAAKAGVIQMTKYYACYLGKYNINVNCISPGPFPSEIVQENQNFIANLSNKTALQRIGKPHELKGAFVFLSSSASDFVTGHNLVVDGGWTAW